MALAPNLMNAVSAEEATFSRFSTMEFVPHGCVQLHLRALAAIYAQVRMLQEGASAAEFDHLDHALKAVLMWPHLI